MQNTKEQLGQSNGGRTVTINWQQQNDAARFPTNRISTTRYSWYSFVPVSFLIQFAKVQNTFYAVGAVLQAIPAISTNDPLATIIPLAYVISVGMLKEFLSDYKRYQNDKKTNQQPCTVIVKEGQEFVSRVVSTADVRVGDIVQLRDGDIVPADMVLLTTKDQRGEAFNKTASLDGETNLKPKLALKKVNDTIYGPNSQQVEIACHEPIADLYSFNARVSYGSEQTDIDLKQFMHRGATVCNSEKVTGLVVHTSTDCKLVMNQGRYRFKQSSLYKGINALMLFNIALILIIAGIYAAFTSQFVRDNYDSSQYIFYDAPDASEQALSAFFSFYLLFNQFVPLELLIILEMAQIFVVKYIDNDSEMCYAVKQESASSSVSLKGMGPAYELKTCQVQNYSVHEDLGQIDYLFCDKTGTLTKNELVFNKWASQGKVNPEKCIETMLEGPKEQLKDFLRCICLCHDVLLISLKNKEGVMTETKSGSSQDELCLIEMAEKKGLAKLVARDATTMTIEVLGETEKYDVVKVFEFSSERKMMSVIVKNHKSDQHYVFAKGASDSLCTKLEQRTSSAEADMNLANNFASEGLRVLAFGAREIDCATVDLSSADAVSRVESGLTLVGITAVEDLLQDNVANCIQEFRLAGIKVWMLTGDKGETALEIGLRCGLYDRNTMTIFNVVESTDLNELISSLTSHVASIEAEELGSNGLEPCKFAMAVAGKSLPTIYGSAESSALIKQLFKKCEAVIVYRSSPAQKAETVKYIRKHLGTSWHTPLTTMAIGDGANDVNMIQSAHIGIGIFGKEGNQAASFSDYALPCFKDLRQLLFWHGRSMGVKSTNFACWFAYKGMLFSVPLVFFNAYAAFSGLTFVEDYFYALYEVILTTWAIGGYLLFEYDVSSHFKSSANGGTYLAHHYKHCKDVLIKPFYKRLAAWCLFAWYSGAVFFYMSFFAYEGPSHAVDSSGKLDGIWTSGFGSFSILIAVHHLTIFMSTKAFNGWLIGFYIFSVLCFMPLTVMLNEYTAGTAMYHTTFSDVLSSPLYWLVVVVGTVAVCAPYYAYLRYQEVVQYPDHGSGEQRRIACQGFIRESQIDTADDTQGKWSAEPATQKRSEDSLLKNDDVREEENPNESLNSCR